LLSKVRQLIISIIDFVHKPFAKWIPAQTFRYLACGGGNTVLGLVLFSIIYNYVFHGVDSTVIKNLNITTRVATLLMTFCVNFPIGFILSSYVVFPESQIHSRIQFFRYSAATLTFIMLAYVLTKVFAIILPFVRADVANIFVNIVIAFLSYLSQRFFTFKITPDKEQSPEN
jgi:hypothetical protein